LSERLAEWVADVLARNAQPGPEPPDGINEGGLPSDWPPDQPAAEDRMADTDEGRTGEGNTPSMLPAAAGGSRDGWLHRTLFAAAAWVAAFTAATWIIGGREPGARILGDVVYVLPVGLAAALSVLAARRVTGVQRRFWLLLAVSNVLWLGGELVWSFQELVLHRITPFPSLADLFYLSSYALVPPAVVLGFRSSVRVRLWRALLDASIVAVALAYAGFMLLIGPQLEYGASLATATGVAYPMLGVVILIVVGAFGLGAHGGVPRSIVLAGVAFAVSALTDAGYTYLAVLHEYVSGGWVSVGWQVEAVLLCAAALVALRRNEPDATPRLVARDVGLPPVLLGVGATLTIVLFGGVGGGLGLGSAIVAVYAVSALVLRLYLTTVEKAHVTRRLEQSVESLKRAEEERRTLLDRVLQSAEQERRRIAADLHDSSVQNLTALTFDLERARRRVERHDIVRGAELLERVGTQLSEEVRSLRRLMADIRPPMLDEQGLEGALREHVDVLRMRAGVDCTVRTELPERLDPERETVLYRVAQEALANVAKHAGARRAWLSLRGQNGSVVLELGDDGAGFAPQPVTDLVRDGHFGLAVMRERVEMAGGSWELKSRPGMGTTIRVVFHRDVGKNELRVGQDNGEVVRSFDDAAAGGWAAAGSGLSSAPGPARSPRP
jgi:signal transduction histidine kinase